MTGIEIELEALVRATSTLLTVVDLAADNLSDAFKDMVRVPADNVREVLKSFPDVLATNAFTEFRESDCSVVRYMTARDGYGESRGARLTHMPTGISRQSESKPSYEENEAVVIAAVREAVEAQANRVQRNG
jgi:hypothetical protein